MRTAISLILILFFLLGCKSSEEDVNYGLNHYKMGLYNQAIPSLITSVSAFEKQFPTDPRVTQAYLALGVMAQSDKQNEKAEHYMKQALIAAENVSKDKDIHFRNAHNTIGNFYIAREKYKLALPHLNQALELSKAANTDPVLTAIDIDNIALVYSELGEHKKSLELSNEALASNNKLPDHKHFLRTKGIILFNQGKTFERMKEYKRAIKTYDASIDVLTQLIVMHPYESWRLEIVQKAKASAIASMKS